MQLLKPKQKQKIYTKKNNNKNLNKVIKKSATHRQQRQQLHHQQLHLTKQPQNDDGERYLHGVRRWLHGAGGGMGARGIARSGVGEATEEGKFELFHLFHHN